MSERTEYDALLRQVGKPTAAPAADANEYDSILRDDAADSERQLRSSYTRAGVAEPEHEAKVLQYARRTGYAPDVVERKLNDVKREVGYQDIGPESLWRDFPTTANWLGQPENMAVAKDDVANLKGLEWWLGTWAPAPTVYGTVPVQTREGSVQRAYRQGQAQLRMAQIANAALAKGVDPDDFPEMANLRKQSEASLGEGDRFLGESVTGTARILPGILAGWQTGASVAGAAATGVALAGQAGPQAFAPEEVLTVPAVASAGFVVGSGLNSYHMETGLAYDEIVREMKASGGPVDYAAAAKAAQVAGSINALLEIIPASAALRYFPGIKTLFGAGATRGAAKALVAPSMFRAVLSAGKAVGVQTLAESGTEGAQRAVTATAREGAVKASGGTADFSTIPAEAGEEFVGAIESFWLLSLPGAVGEFGGVASQARRAKGNVAHLEAMTESSRASKLRERMPEKFREFVEKQIAERGEVSNVFIPVEQWTTYWQSQNVDPGKAAERVLSDPKRYTEAVTTGGDLVIPVADYLTSIAPTEHHEGLRDDVRLYQGDLTLREAEAAAKTASETLAADQRATLKRSKDDVAALPESERTIYTTEYEKARGAGVPEAEADAHARIAQAFWRTRADRWNESATAPVSAKDLYDRYQLTIQRQKTERAPKRRLFAEDLRSPDDVPAWIRDQGGIAALDTSMIRPGSEDYRRVPLGLRRGRGKGGRTVEELAEQLVEARFFEDDKAAIDWVVEAIHNPTGIALPTIMTDDVTDRDATIAADEYYRKQRVQRGAEILTTAEQITAMGVASGRQALRKAVTVHRATPEEIAAHDLTPGEVIYLPEARGVFTVALDEDGRIVLQDGVDITLGDEQTVKAVRVGEKGTSLEQPAFHGSPHRFDKFSTEKIGTGEGAQAYGWGLYFSSSEDVAEYYRRALSNYAPFEDGKLLPVEPESPEAIAASLASVYVYQQSSDPYGRVIETLQDKRFSPYDVAESEQLIAVLKDWRRRGVTLEKSGQKYQVEVPEDSELLDWRTSFKRQPEIHAKLIAANLSTDFARFQNGEDFYRMLANTVGGDAAASAELKAAGIPGHIYEGNSSGAKNYVIYDEFRVSVQRTHYQGGRGFIQFGPGGRKFNISLLKKADPSTLAHETAHFYLEVLGDMATGENVAPEIAEDYAAILKWLGVENRAQIGTEQHEKFARGWESYLMEGRTPSVEMAGVFARFKAWLTKVYKEIAALRVELSPEIRSVFDRLLASEQEIAEAVETQGYKPFEALKEKMTSAEWAAYQETAERAHAEGEDELRGRLMGDTRRELESWFKTEREETRAAVEAELATVPVYRALRFLQRGDMLDGTEVDAALKGEDGKPFKLSRKALIAQYGKEFLATLPRPYIYSREGGVHPDVIAPLFGFGSGDEMVLKIQGAQKYEQAVQAETQRRLEAKYGDLLKETSKLAEEAMDSAHSERRAEQILIELRVLARSLSGDEGVLRRIPINLVALREDARAVLSEKKAGAIQPGVYQRAEAAAGRRAFEAAAKGSLALAYDEKAKQLWNFTLYRAALETKKQVESDITYLRSAADDKTRARLGKAGADYLEQVDGLLERYDFRRRTGKDVARRQSLRAFVQEQEAAGRDVAISENLLDEARRLHYRELGAAELHEIREAVENIRHLARLKNELRVAANKRNFEGFKAEALASLHQHVKSPGRMKLSQDTRSAAERFAQFGHSLDAGLVKIEELALQMDGGDANGPWAQILVHPFADAEAREYDLTLQVTEKLIESLAALPEPQRLRLRSETRHIRSIDQELSFNEIFAVALNMGNASNYEKLLKGYQTTAGDLIPWTPGTIEEIVGHLTEADWNYIQSVWDTLESLWPEMEAMEKRLHGLAPPKIEAQSFTRTFSDGTTKTYPGGYYPVAYHPVFSAQGEQQSKAAGVGVSELFEAGYGRAMTAHGHLQNRVETFARPILLDMFVIPRHLGQAVHDLTHREAVLDAWRFLTDAEIRVEIVHRMGLPYYKAMQERVRKIANAQVIDSAVLAEGWTKAMEHSRTALVGASMGFKATVFMQNFINPAPAIAEIGAKWFATGLVEYVKGRGETVAWVKSVSGEMRHRMKTLDVELNREMRKLTGKHGPLDEVKRAGFFFAAYTNAVTDFPTWVGAYRRASAPKSEGGEGLGHDEAVRFADSKVRLALGAGGTKDLAAIQDSKVWRPFTMFMGWFNVVYNSQRRLLRETRGAVTDGELSSDAARLFGKWLGLILVPALLGEIIVSRGPGNDDSDESVAWWAIRKTLLYYAAMIPLLREVANAVDKGGDVRFAPMTGVYQAAAKAVEKGWDGVTGERPMLDAAMATTEGAAMWMGLPTAQSKITGGHLFDVATGEDEFSIDRLLYRKGKAEE